jgi:proteasome lid subunit RPN8/RPN11
MPKPLDKFINRILLGDCVQVMGQMPSDSVDVIVTDPPYVCRYQARDRRTVANDDRCDWIERMVEVSLSEQSTTCAVADQHDLQRKLIAIDGWGHKLHGLFHSHPGQGRGATWPSGIDLATHEEHERGGYPLVGAIFEASGFVRFFSHSRPFTVNVYGTGVERYEENLFKIGNVSHHAPWPGVHGDRERDRIARKIERI